MPSSADHLTFFALPFWMLQSCGMFFSTRLTMLRKGPSPNMGRCFTSKMSSPPTTAAAPDDGCASIDDLGRLFQTASVTASATSRNDHERDHLAGMPGSRVVGLVKFRGH